jgi:two-component system nitrogen regulation sensor histidine kinase GlnL
LLQGAALPELMPEDSPLLTLVRQCQRDDSSISDYGVALALMREASRLVDVHVSPVGGGSGQVLIVLHPCSVAQRLNHQLSHRGRARSVAGMASTLAHEIKNPLSGIRGAAQLIEASVGAEERPLIRLICDETDRICALVDRMEQFAEGQPLERGPVNIYEVLERVRRLAESGFGSHVRFHERYDPSLPEVDGDRDQLVRLFLNLIKNACEAAPKDEGEVVLATQYTHGLALRVPNARDRVELPITVLIQDNGPGIGDDVAGHLFEPFITTKRTGTGLGLAMAAKIVGDHGGVIEFDNLARGAVFRIRLPAWRRGRSGAGGQRR